jgi:hypothetical protein
LVEKWAEMTVVS